MRILVVSPLLVRLLKSPSQPYPRVWIVGLSSPLFLSFPRHEVFPTIFTWISNNSVQSFMNTRQQSWLASPCKVADCSDEEWKGRLLRLQAEEGSQREGREVSQVIEGIQEASLRSGGDRQQAFATCTTGFERNFDPHRANETCGL